MPLDPATTIGMIAADTTFRATDLTPKTNGATAPATAALPPSDFMALLRDMHAMLSSLVQQPQAKQTRQPRAAKLPKDPLAETLAAVAAAKAARGLPYDEAAVRSKLADPLVLRKTRRDPAIKAQLAALRAAAAGAPTPAAPDGVADL